MKKLLILAIVVVIVGVAGYVDLGKVKEILVARVVAAKPAEAGMTPKALKKLGEAGYQADPAIPAQIVTGGQPLGRWKEGLSFEGIAPMPWLKSAANRFPDTEELQPDEIRVTLGCPGAVHPRRGEPTRPVLSEGLSARSATLLAIGKAPCSSRRPWCLIR